MDTDIDMYRYRASNAFMTNNIQWFGMFGGPTASPSWHKRTSRCHRGPCIRTCAHLWHIYLSYTTSTQQSNMLHTYILSIRYAAHMCSQIYMHMHMHMQSDILHTSIGSQTYCTHVQPDTHAHAHATNCTAHTYTARCTACIHAVRHIAHTFSYCTCMPWLTATQRTMIAEQQR